MKTAYKSRFENIWYGCQLPGRWTVYDNTNGLMAAIGPHYNSRAELLADLERFCKERGYC